MGDDAGAGERRVNEGIVTIDPVDGGIFLTEITHVVVRAKY